MWCTHMKYIDDRFGFLSALESVQSTFKIIELNKIPYI